MIYADDLEENHIQDNTGEWHIAKPIENRAFNKDWLRLRLETNE